MPSTSHTNGNSSESAQNQKSTFLICFLIGVLGGSIATITIIMILYHFVDIDFIDSSTCGNVYKLKYCLFAENWDSGEYLSAITSFYSTIITILIGLLAVLATLTFLVVRTTAGHHAKEAIEAEVERYFDTQAAVKLVEEKLHRLTDESVDQKLGDINTQLEKIIRVLDEEGFTIPGKIRPQ